MQVYGWMTLTWGKWRWSPVSVAICKFTSWYVFYFGWETINFPFSFCCLSCRGSGFFFFLSWLLSLFFYISWCPWFFFFLLIRTVFDVFKFLLFRVFIFYWIGFIVSLWFLVVLIITCLCLCCLIGHMQHYLFTTQHCNTH